MTHVKRPTQQSRAHYTTRHVETVLYDPAPARRLIAKHEDLAYPYVCKFGAADLQIDRGVFCPTLSNASRLLLEVVSFTPGQSVLDVFSGSGAFGINAALAGAEAVMVDISSTAADCARANVIINKVSTLVDVRQGIMRDCIAPDEIFDLVIANPPLLPGVPSDSLTSCIFSPQFDATTSFIRGIGRNLSAAGSCYLVTSDVMDRYGYDLDRLCRENGLTSVIAEQRNVGYETYRVHKIRLNQAPQEQSPLRKHM
jgi:16S rRNA G1207 methylase RsmC